MIEKIKNNLLYIKERENLAICAAIIVLLIGIYWPIFTFEFVVYDDGGYVYDNPRVARGLTLENIMWAFTTYEKSNWHPLTWISYLMDIELFGMNPGAQHAINLLLHTINSIFLFIILTKITGLRFASSIVAGLFAVHPLHVESVAWISERKDVLSTFFFLSSLFCYARYVQKSSRAVYWLILLFFAMGLMAKPMLVTFPFVLLLLDIWPFQRINPLFLSFRGLTLIKRLIPFISEKIPLFLLSAISCGLTFLSQKEGGAVSSVDFIPRISNAIISYFMYLVKTVAPSHLSVFYPFPTSINYFLLVASLILFSCATVIAVKCLRKAPWFFVGLCWYLGTLVPVIGIIQVGRQAMADRYTYIPLIGVFIVISWSAYFLLKRYRSGIKVYLLLSLSTVFLFAIISARQVKIWENTFRLFEHAIKVTENNDVAHLNLGLAYAERRMLERAMDHYKRALEINPSSARAWNNMGGYWAKKRDYHSAINCYKNAILYDPTVEEFYLNLATTYMSTGDIDKAIFLYKKTTQMSPDYYQAHHYLGLAYLTTGKIDEAITHLDSAYRIFPEHRDIRNNLGLAKVKKKEITTALNNYKNAMVIRPEEAKIVLKANHLLLKKRELISAIDSYRKAISFQPGYRFDFSTLDGLIDISNLNHDFMRLLPIFTEHIQEFPDSAIVAYHIGCIYALEGETENALHWLNHAVMRGFNDWEFIKADFQLQSITQLPAYQGFFERLRPKRLGLSLKIDNK
jgi:tetratricopeptide (TPR) repeat protein